jgi:peptidoglycan LD-endopeptidase CwlK
MQAGWVSLYFVAGCAVLAMLVFPQSLGAIKRHASQRWRLGWPDPAWWWHRGVQRWRAWREAGHMGSMAAMGAQPHTATSDRRHGLRLFAWTVVLLSVPVLLTLAWARWQGPTLDGFDDYVQPVDSRLSQLLAGERLSPPAPLPPEVFTTAEVEVERPMTASADRRWDQMQPDFVQRLLRVFKVMRDEHGYDMVLLEGYRSPERQAMLAAQGQHVTMVGAWQSYHQYGMAADVAFWRQGRVVISERDPWAMRGYDLLGEVAEAHGLTWGGRWKMRDLGHVEWRTDEVRAAMRAARRSQALGNDLSAPDTSGNTNTP